MARPILEQDQNAALECLYAIQAIALLMQKAHEETDAQSDGIYGAAVLIERSAKELLAFMGEV